VPAKRNAPDADPRRWYAYQSHRNRAHYQLKTEPLCRFCKQEGRTTPATVADHVIPVDGDWWRFRMGELQSLCYDCHDRVKRTIELRGYSSKVDTSGWPIDPNHPVYGQSPEPQPSNHPTSSRARWRQIQKAKRELRSPTIVEDGGGERN